MAAVSACDKPKRAQSNSCARARNAPWQPPTVLTAHRCAGTWPTASPPACGTCCIASSLPGSLAHVAVDIEFTSCAWLAAVAGVRMRPTGLVSYWMSTPFVAFASSAGR
eukprot:3858940-Prymnesium_polylepis.3